jgi:hypothetical protein
MRVRYCEKKLKLGPWRLSISFLTVAAKYNIKRRAKPEKTETKSQTDDEKDEEIDLKLTENEPDLQRGFKYFLYHHHSFLGVVCVKHDKDLPRYARGFLFAFDLMLNLMFALTLHEAGMGIAQRLVVTGTLRTAALYLPHRLTL